jgi:hypothetical protein
MCGPTHQPSTWWSSLATGYKTPHLQLVIFGHMVLKGTVMESPNPDTASFDADTYAILVKPLLKGEARIEEVLSR